MAIGGAIGGAVDPTKVYGPHVGDGQAQTATDGSPISWVMGTAWVAGCICDVGKRTEVSVEDPSQGKGSGTESYHYEARQNFAILVCESDEIKASTIKQVLMVEQDGKIVYDVRPGSTMVSDSNKWASNVTFLYGDEAQLPPTTFDGIHGTDNEPAYRGVLLAIFNQFNLTSAGDRIPSFRFLVESGPVGDGANVNYDDPSWAWVYEPTGGVDPSAYSGIDFDYSAWSRALGMFATRAAIGPTTVNTVVGENPTQDNAQIWMRRRINARAGADITIVFTYESYGYVYWNGEQVFIDTNNNIDKHAHTITVPGASVLYANEFAAMVSTRFDNTGDLIIGATVTQDDPAGTIPTLANVVSAISLRGSLTTEDIDVTELSTVTVPGYTIAKQMGAVSALGPLLGAYFAYGSEYDGKINFKFYGADAVMTIDEDDILEANDANDGAITSNLRNNATEFPRRVIGQYYDPAQNYMPVTVMQVRRAAGVTATGDRAFDIPVVMDADTAQQTVDKALKLAYAQLEGTLQFSVPFAGTENVYLSLVAGDPVLFRGKRWIVTEPIISAGYIKLTLQYDRQSAYTSDVQAIAGLAPTPPVSRYSGPTVIVPMNLPQLQTQDAYGIYVVTYSDPHNDGWRSATIQMSLDDGATWQTVGTSNTDSVTGALTEADGGTSLVVQTNGDLSSVGSAQLDARQNPAALLHDTDAEILQYGTADEDSGVADLYTLTDLRRAELGTTQITGAIGDQFVTLNAAQLIPIDTSFAGTTIKFRAVGGGENADDATVVSIVYNPDTVTVISGGTFGDGL